MFSERDVDHSHVVVPIAAGHKMPNTEKPHADAKPKEDDSLSTSSAGAFSVESLKAEIESDVAVDPSQKATAYDRMFHLNPL